MPSSYNDQLDKITQRELNINLNEKINLSYDHLSNNEIHVTAEEKESWNSMAEGSLVTSISNGLMSKEDKIKLDGIEEAANNYIHPKSGVTYGTYIQITTDVNGHVIAGANPDRLEITVANADTVNGISSDRIALLQSPVFIGNPTAPTPDGTDIYSITNVNFVVNKIKELEELIMAKIEEYHPGATNDDGTVNGGQ